MTFDLKHDAIVLPKPISGFISNGYTTQALVTNRRVTWRVKL
jgi:hypothetical protein